MKALKNERVNVNDFMSSTELVKTKGNSKNVTTSKQQQSNALAFSIPFTTNLTVE